MDMASVKQYRVPYYKVRLVRDGDIKTPEDPDAITRPVQVFDILKDEVGQADREHFLVVMLNTKNRIIGINTVSIGTVNASLVHPREVFKPALIAGASSIIVVHNHPSGDPAPSQEDLAVVKKLVEAGEILGIAVRDSLVIGNTYFSFREKGLLK